ncbi:hypothetical protein [Streptococcus cuniculi]|uniref:Uncharacterized protein n=1 Tax=Streptococcus cuniculi TaxID=1432788 RepID=A0A4Y9J891_9STRE|nr:hypothetical protein E4T82_09030 [Streptococcus cuniculi]
MIQLNVGEMTATNLSLAGENSILTDLGSIDLQLNPKSAVHIDVDAELGSVSNTFHYQGKTAGQLNLQTATGDIRVR